MNTDILWKRSAILLASGLALYLLFSQWAFLASPSERFHATVPLVWLLYVYLNRKRGEKFQLGSLGAAFIGMLGGAVLFFWKVASIQSQLAGGRTDWIEPIYKISLLASCFVIYTVLAKSLTLLTQRISLTRTSQNPIRNRGLLVLRIVFTFALFAPYLFTTFNVHRFKIGNVGNPRTTLGLPYQTVSFPSDIDGVSLSGWFIPANNSQSTVIICHGIGANKGNMMSMVPFLNRRGFNVLLFDFRGHGESTGHTTSFGFYEARDVKGAVQYLKSRSDSKNIGALAFSMGGAALLHAVGDLPEIRGVVVDSTFADFPAIVQSQTQFLPVPLNGLMVSATNLYSRIELGVSLEQMSSRPLITGVGPRPLLIIHGTADTLIAPSQANANFAAAREPKQLWLIKGANHCEGHAVAQEQYENRVADFFGTCLK